VRPGSGSGTVTLVVAADRFVFVQLHTCGGEFVKDFLTQFVAGARLIGRHVPRRLIPPSLVHLPTLGFVRNPWSYYVLWYALEARRRAPSLLYRALSEEGRLGFAPTLERMLELGADGRLLDQVVAALPPRYTGRGLNLPGFALEPIRASGLGFFSFLYRHMYDAPGISHIRRVERLREELIPMLVAVGQPVSAAMRARALEAPQESAAERRYLGHYGETLRDRVAERDAVLIARYGYQFAA